MGKNYKVTMIESREKLLKNNKPEFRKKGYESFISDNKIAEIEVWKKISDALSEDNTKNLSDKDKLICDQLNKSYLKKLKNISLSKEDFCLSGHEIDELYKLDRSKILRYCIYRYKYNKYPELYLTENYPPCVQIEVSSICNFRCIMCYQADESFSKKSNGYMGNMDLELFKKCIDELEGNVEAVTLASRGEPLLNPQLQRMLEYCNGKFLALKLNTNASLLDEKMAHILLQSDLQTLVFSMDAATKGVYEKIRVNGNFEAVVGNIKKFSQVKKQHYPKSKLNVRVSGVKINDEQHLSEMRELLGGFVDSAAFVNYNPWETAYTNLPHQIKAPCSDLFRRMFVWWDGVVNPCDYDYKSTLSSWKFTAGQISLSEIWLSDQYNKLRDLHLSGGRSSKSPCNRCVAI